MRIILRALLGTPVLFAGLLAIFPCVNPAPALAGTTTLITYYPAPNGNYSKVTLYPQTQPSGVCRSGAMYVDNTTGAVGYCVDNNIKPTDGTLIGGTLAGTGSWGKFQASTPVNFNDVANKGYVDAASGGVTYKGVTSLAYNGNCGGVNGIYSCNAACSSNFSGSHMCTEGEIVRSGLASAPIIGWVSCDSYSQLMQSGGNFIDICLGVTGYVEALMPNTPGAADCSNWKAGGVGPAIIGGTTTAVDCNTLLKIHCCK